MSLQAGEAPLQRGKGIVWAAPVTLPTCAPALVSLTQPSVLFFKFIYFIYLFLAVLGLRCCAWAFSSCGERELLFIVVRVRVLLVTVASIVAEHGL